MRRPPLASHRRDSLLLYNHLRPRKLDLRLLRSILRAFVFELLDEPEFQLEIHLVGAEQITRLNETYLRHQGVTDVIAFDYAEPGEASVQGEIFVCLPEAVRQARRFRTSWERELVRYLLHGILHLCGDDDRTPAKRRAMKRAEDSALRKLALRYRFEKISGAVGATRRGISELAG